MIVFNIEEDGEMYEMIGLVYPDELRTVYSEDVKLLVFLPTDEEICRNKMGDEKSFCFGIDFKDSEFWQHGWYHLNFVIVPNKTLFPAIRYHESDKDLYFISCRIINIIDVTFINFANIQ